MQIANPLGYDEIKKRQVRDDEIKQLFVKMHDKYKPLDLVLVIFSGTSSAYKVIKTCGDLLYGVATQGVEEKNVFKSQDQTVSNILLKINNKLGGVNFALSRMNRIFTMHLQDLYNGPLMIFGADVTHPSPGDKQLDSIVGVVGSLDSDCCNYAARLFVQRSPTGQAYEMIHDLDKMFKSLLQSFFNVHKQFPKKIVFYRDGVSEGQFQLVLRHEINRIRAACQSISSGYEPAITFVVVQKRHHTRFFPVNQQDKKGKSENIPPGTVVDRDLVSKYMFDFFLCSHSGIQGTSRPCRYFVLHDDNNFTMNQIQVLSFYLCHVYSRCPRSVSYPSPAYFAHLAAFRGRDYIRKDLVLR
jgi:eukaryotic translation initiation factor 2C